MMEMFLMLRRFAGLMMALAVMVGCSKRPDDNLNTYIEEVKNRPRGNIEPLPPLRTYDAYIYNVMAMRSPFDQPVELPEETVTGTADPKVEPDWSRPREYLEGFNFDSLQMVGSLRRKGRFWVLMKDPEGGINRVAVGNYVGKDHGEIVSASDVQVDVVEIVSDGLGGWLKRPRTLTLAEKE